MTTADIKFKNNVECMHCDCSVKEGQVVKSCDNNKSWVCPECKCRTSVVLDNIDMVGEDLNKKITTKQDAFKAGYLIASGVNVKGEYYSSVENRPPNLNMSSTFAYAGGGETEDEALSDAFNWIEKQLTQR